MKRRERRARKAPLIVRKAERALEIAVAKTLEEHRRSGDPIVVWKNGRVVSIPARSIPRNRKLSRP